MSQAITIRLPDEAAEAVKQIAQRERRSVSEVGTRIMEEWLRQNRFPHIEFRTFNGEREACIKDRLQVWQVIEVAKSYALDALKTAAHLSLRPEQVRSALNYYSAYPEEINRALAENAVGYERLREMLPNLEVFEVPSTVSGANDDSETA